MPDVGRQFDLRRGALDAMILKVLSTQANHGYGVARAIEAASGNVLQIEEGTLYPALHRLERRGDLTADWRATEHHRRGKYYRLTARGRARLVEELDVWARVSAAVGGVLGLGVVAPEGGP